MEQREVRDEQGVRWTCVQAYAGLEGEKAEQATEIAKTADAKVPVVCTPSGGAQSVRLHLPTHWLEQFKDQELISCIEAARE